MMRELVSDVAGWLKLAEWCESLYTLLPLPQPGTLPVALRHKLALSQPRHQRHHLLMNGLVILKEGKGSKGTIKGEMRHDGRKIHNEGDVKVDDMLELLNTRSSNGTNERKLYITTDCRMDVRRSLNGIVGGYHFTPIYTINTKEIHNERWYIQKGPKLSQESIHKGKKGHSLF